MFYTPGHLYYLMYANEPTGITEGSPDPTLPALPTSLSILGQINPSDIVTDDGTEKGYGAGAPIGLYDQEKGWTGEMTIPLRVASIDFIQRCLWAGSTGTYGLDELALFYGTSTAAKVFRLSQCQNLAIDFREPQQGGVSELNATATMWATYPDTATVVVPTLAQMRAIGAPASWHDMTSFKIGQGGGVDGAAGTGGTEERQSLAGITFTESHDLERKGFREHLTGVGADATRAAYGLMMRSVRGEGEISFHAMPTAFLTSNSWGDIEMIIGTTIWRLVGVTPRQRRQPGVEASQQIGYTVPIQFDYIEVYDLV